MTATIVQSNPRHLGKNTVPNWIVWLGLTAVCLVCGSGLIWSALVCCDVSATLPLGLNVHLNKCRATSRVYQAEMMTDTHFTAIIKLPTEIFQASTVAWTPSNSSFSYHFLYKKVFKNANNNNKEKINTHTEGLNFQRNSQILHLTQKYLNA